MVLTAAGDVIVSDGAGGGVYRLPAKGNTLERLDGGDFISPQTPAMHPDGAHLFVPDYVRGIGVLEIETRRVRWLSMRGQFALNGIDGLYFNRGRLIAVQNGTSPERVVAFTLDATLTRIELETIIERNTATLGDPTHGVIAGKRFWYIAATRSPELTRPRRALCASHRLSMELDGGLVIVAYFPSVNDGKKIARR